MSQNQSEQAGKATVMEDAVPSRKLGLTIMCIIIVFVAYWMNQQAPAPAESMGASAEIVTVGSGGFRADAWMLPDEPLLGFVEIPGGTFIMGSNPVLDRMAYPNERWSENRRQGEIELPIFLIGRHEVSNAQFAVYQQATGAAPAVNAAENPPHEPVTGVTLPEALAYARWLDTQLRNSATTPGWLQNFLRGGAQVTLPSEAEWEKAARGTDGSIFPWGAQPRTDLANISSNGVVPVNTNTCNECAYGLSEMSGNVWELTRSPLQDYPFGSTSGAGDLQEDALWVMRGGSFADAIGNVRAAVRGGVDPGVRNASIGFRLAISTQ